MAKTKKEKKKLTPEQKAERRAAAMTRRAESDEKKARESAREVEIMDLGGLPAVATYRRLCKARDEVSRLETKLLGLGVEGV